VKIELNRFSENLGSVFLSLMGRAEILNSTAFNQCTHDIFSIRQRKPQTPDLTISGSVQVTHNQILFAQTPALSDTNFALRNELITMFGLLFPIP
jgi:GTPase Era involved in 16S rRNA processing